MKKSIRKILIASAALTGFAAIGAGTLSSCTILNQLNSNENQLIENEQIDKNNDNNISMNDKDTSVTENKDNKKTSVTFSNLNINVGNSYLLAGNPIFMNATVESKDNIEPNFSWKYRVESKDTWHNFQGGVLNRYEIPSEHTRHFNKGTKLIVSVTVFNPKLKDAKNDIITIEKKLEIVGKAQDQIIDNGFTISGIDEKRIITPASPSNNPDWMNQPIRIGTKIKNTIAILNSKDRVVAAKKGQSVKITTNIGNYDKNSTKISWFYRDENGKAILIPGFENMDSIAITPGYIKGSLGIFYLASQKTIDVNKGNINTSFYSATTWFVDNNGNIK